MPLNEQVPPSTAHFVHEVVEDVEVVGVVEVVEVLVVDVPVLYQQLLVAP